METVSKLGRKLEKLIKDNAADHSSVSDILDTLQSCPVTLEILQKTHIGMTVNSLRKASSDDKVVATAKTLIKKWKRNLSADDGDRKKTSTPPPRKDEDSTRDASGSGEGSPEREALYDGGADTSDPMRLKCRGMLATALRTGGTPEGGGDPDVIAAGIEDAIFDEFENTDTKYKTRLRSRIHNLKDTRNPDLRENVLLGHIQPKKVAVMTSEEMASEEMKKMRAAMTKESIDDHQMVVTGGTVTDLLKCGKCGKRRVTYNQVQTRSADEPMTTFCFCNECGHRWKFC